MNELAERIKHRETELQRSFDLAKANITCLNEKLEHLRKTAIQTKQEIEK